MIDPQQHAAMEKYLQEVRSVVQSCDSVLTEGDMTDVNRLIDHGEPAEGLNVLAWVIAQKKVRVPANTIQAIRTLTEGLVDPADLPANLDEFADSHLENN